MPAPVKFNDDDIWHIGKPDLVVANSGANTVSLLIGNGDGTFGAKTDYLAGLGAFSIAVGVKAQQPDAAKTLIAFLRAPALVPILKAKGLEPG